MNWITTNIKLPEEVYMELKIKAAKERKSVAGLIQESLITDNKPKQKRISAKEAKELLKRVEKLSTKIAKQNKGVNFTQGIIDMRYEQ